MSRWLDLKLLLLLLVCTAFLIVFSNLGAFAYETVFKESNGYSEGTKVGTIAIDGLTKDQAMSKVLETIDAWKANSTFQLRFQEDGFQLDTNFLQIDIKESIDGVANGQATPLLATINKTNLQDQVLRYNEILSTSIDFDQLTNEMQKTIVKLEPGTFSYDLSNCLSSPKQDKIQELSNSTITGFDKELDGFIDEWIKMINPISLKSLESFSLLSIVEGDRMADQRLQALNIVAASLYESTLKAGFDIKERHIHPSLPAYSKLGFDAKIKPKDMDLIFTNTNMYEVKINLKRSNSTLITAVQGYPGKTNYEIVLQNEQSFVPKEILQPSPTLQSRTTKMLKEGVEGKLVKVYRNKLDQTGGVIEAELISEDFYPPLHKVVQVPLKPDEKTIEAMKELSNLENEIKDALNNTSSEETEEEANQQDSNQEDDEQIWGAP